MWDKAQDLDHILTSTRELWEELRGKRIFVTGGTGFFGRWLLESFAWANDRLALGASAVVLTRKDRSPSDPAVCFHKGDVRDFVFPEGHFSHIIHAATESSTQPDPLSMLDTIVDGTRRVLDFAVHCGAAKFLLTSSGAVYGKQPGTLTHVPETYPGAPDTTDPHWAYGEGKRLAELLCAIYCRRHGLETKIARGFAFVGPYLPLDAHFAIGNFIRDRIAGGPIRVRGDGTPYRSYLYSTDLMIWLWTILIKGQPCRPYNVGSEEALTIAEVASAVSAALGARVPVQIARPPSVGAPPERYVPSTERARTELHLAQTVPLDQAILKTAAWSSH